MTKPCALNCIPEGKIVHSVVSLTVLQNHSPLPKHLCFVTDSSWPIDVSIHVLHFLLLDLLDHDASGLSLYQIRCETSFPFGLLCMKYEYIYSIYVQFSTSHKVRFFHVSVRKKPGIHASMMFLARSGKRFSTGTTPSFQISRPRRRR